MQDFITQNFSTIITCFFSCVSIFILLVLNVIIKIKKSKSKDTSSEEALFDLVETLIIKAECFTGFTGSEKKQYVLTAVNQFCLDNDIKFDTDYVSNLIEKLIILSKSVNIGG